MARLLSLILLVLVMSTCQKRVYCMAQADQRGSRNNFEASIGMEQESRVSSSIFKLPSFLQSFLRGEGRRSVKDGDSSERKSRSDASPATAKHVDQYESGSSSFSKTFPQTFPKSETPQIATSSNQISENGETPRVGRASSTSDVASVRTLRQTTTDVHQISEGASSFPTNMRTEGDPDAPSKEAFIDDIRRTSSRQFERSTMKMPVRGRLVMSGYSPSSKSAQSSQENGKSPVLRRIREYAEKYTIPHSTGEFVRIGDADIPRRKVTNVGDVDGNKVADYIVSNVAAKNYSGTVRLYLMGEGDSFLYTRDLIPGKWGFEHPELNAGDRFGDTVFRLPSTGGSSKCFIAIAAPGDRSTKDENGAVYVLELTEKGNVNNHTKLSATEFLKLVEEQQQEEQTQGTAPDRPLRTVRPQSSGLQLLHGVTSMLLINATGSVQAVINVNASKHNNLLQQVETHLVDDEASKKTLDAGADGYSSRVTRDDSCLFTKTECACKLEDSVRGNGKCFEVFQSKEEHEKVICLEKSCPPAYKCSCEGKTICRRVEEKEDVYLPESRGERGELYCTSQRRVVSKTVPITKT